jgi:hypothetical protein
MGLSAGTVGVKSFIVQGAFPGAPGRGCGFLEAVCLVFETVNTGEVQLSVFELMAAGYAAE